jgi:hypothetical protein
MAKYNLNVELTNLEGQILIVTEAVEEKVPAAPTEDGDAAPADVAAADAATDTQDAPAQETPVETRIVEKRVPLTAANAIIKALVADLPSNLTDDTDSKTQKYQIAKKIKASVTANEEVSLKSEEVTVIKTNIGKLWGVMTTGAVVSILEAE